MQREELVTNLSELEAAVEQNQVDTQYTEASLKQKLLRWTYFFGGVLFVVVGVMIIDNAYSEDIEAAFTTIIVLWGIVIAFVWNSDIKSKQRKIYQGIESKNNNKKTLAIKGYNINASHKKASLCGKHELILDAIGKRLLIINIDVIQDKQNNKFETYSDRCFSIDDIRNITVEENGTGIFNTQTQAGSIASSALLGGLVFGGAGAVVGALAGQKNTMINSLKLVFHLKDLDNPIVSFNFIGNVPVFKDSERYKECVEDAEKWLSRFLMLME